MQAPAGGVGIVIGAGALRGLGATLARRFAAEGLQMFVAGRSPEKLEAVAAAIRSEGGSAQGVATDATREDDVMALFERACAAGPLRLAIYNAGNNMRGDLLAMEASFFETCWRVACFGGFLFGREAARRMTPAGEGTLIFTGASASMRGKPQFAAFTAAKAGLRAFAQSMAREFGPQGLHVGHVVIDGGIAGDRLLVGRPESARERGPDRLIALEGIADAYAWLYRQPRSAWTHELDLRTWKEPF